MSEKSIPVFGVMNTLKQSFQVLKDNIKYFVNVICIYTACVYLIILFLPVLISNVAVYIIYVLMLIVVLDKTNASVNNFSFDNYPYMDRWRNSILHVAIICIASAFLVGVGLMLFIIPGLIVFAGVYIAVPIALSENVASDVALKKSWAVSKGRKLSLLGIFLIPAVPMYLMLIRISEALLLGPARGDTFSGSIEIVLIAVIILLAAGLISLYLMITTGVAYHQIQNENMEY